MYIYIYIYIYNIINNILKPNHQLSPGVRITIDKVHHPAQSRTSLLPGQADLTQRWATARCNCTQVLAATHYSCFSTALPPFSLSTTNSPEREACDTSDGQVPKPCSMFPSWGPVPPPPHPPTHTHTHTHTQQHR